MTVRPCIRRLRRTGRAVVIATVVSLVADAAEAGPITFLTALPVPQGQGVIRGQYLFIRASDDPTDAARDLTVTAVPVAVAVGDGAEQERLIAWSGAGRVGVSASPLNRGISAG